MPSIKEASLAEILSLREHFLKENPFQIRYHACHERGWSDSYLIQMGEKPIGYSSVKGKEELSDRDAIFEFYLLPEFQKFSSDIFSELLKETKVVYIESQSNEPLLTSCLYEFGKNIYADVILFEDGKPTDFSFPHLTFRKRNPGENVFGKLERDAGAYVLEEAGEIIADGGFLTHYNLPFADLYMEVREDRRKQGYGSFILQEIKKLCYQEGRVPAARCNLANKASQATLKKAGMKICGFMLTGEVHANT
ncbi:MAG: GNAT family N-acetyltransferase [Bacteroidota bacterium]